MLSRSRVAWPLPRGLSEDADHLLKRAITSDQPGDELAYEAGWLRGGESNQVHKLEIDRKVLRQYIESIKQPVPHSLKKRFDDLG